MRARCCAYRYCPSPLDSFLLCKLNRTPGTPSPKGRCFAVFGDLRGGGEPDLSPVEGRNGINVFSGGEQCQLQLLHSIAVVMTDQGQFHKRSSRIRKFRFQFIALPLAANA